MKHIVGEILYAVFFGFVLLASAGTVKWQRAWILLSVLLIIRTIGTWSILRVHRTLLDERARLSLRRDQPLIDKLLLPGFTLSFVALVGFDGLDGYRLHLLGAPHGIVSDIGLLIFALGWCLVMVALRTNAFATTIVRHQHERGHQVVSRGVYSHVRHPLYAGLVAVMVGMGLWLGSNAGALASLIPTGILALRIHFEEELLRRNLVDYADYAARVRHRLIPGVW